MSCMCGADDCIKCFPEHFKHGEYMYRECRVCGYEYDRLNHDECPECKKHIVLKGPGGIRIELDPTEHYPEDPGQGTPAMVYYENYSATYQCALNEGELDCGGYTLTPAQSRWLADQVVIVSNWYQTLDDA